MKTYDETLNSVLNGVNEYKIRRKKKNQIIINSAFSFVLVCAVAVLVIKLNNPADMLQTEKSDSNVNATHSGVETVGNDETLQSSESNINIDLLGVVVYNDNSYVQQTNLDASSFTADKCLGDARDYEGTYQIMAGDIETKLYTAKESEDILLVKLGNGGEVVLCREDKISVDVIG